MKIRRICSAAMFAWFFLFAATAWADLGQLFWPVDLKDRGDVSIRNAAMARLTAFAKDFSTDPLAKTAEAIVARDRNREDAGAWIGETLQFVAQTLEAHPSAENNNAIRQSALEILDYPLHLDNQRKDIEPAFKDTWFREVGRFYLRSMKPAIEEIKSAKVESGLRVWKLYNMGFVVKSKNHTVGFDVNPGRPTAISPEQLQNLVDSLDILFLSHNHGDHVNTQVVLMMLKAGKKVVMPTPTAANILRRIQDKETNAVKMYDDFRSPRDIGGVLVRCFPGMQGNTDPCNVYAVTLDGLTVAHNGDNDQTRVYDPIPDTIHVDVALANCWSGMLPFIGKIKPDFATTGHELELDHDVPHRVSYLKTYELIRTGKNLPKIAVLNWGETVSYPECRSERKPAANDAR